MKTNRNLAFAKALLLLIIIFVLTSPFLKSQSLNTIYDRNYDGVSDDFTHQPLLINMDSYFNPKDTGDIINSFPIPSTYCQGLTWDGDYLWCSEIIWGLIYQLDPNDGTVIKSFTSPGNYVEGMAWDGTYLWAVDNDGGPYFSNVVYKINPDNGSVIESFEPDDAVWIHGITWDGQYLWMNDFNTHLIQKVDPSTGNILHTIDAPATKCIGLAWDGNHLWTDDFETDTLYCLDPIDGNIIYKVKGPYGNLRDITFDGQYLWAIERTSSIVYQVDVGFVTSTKEYEPYSDNLISLFVYPNPIFDELNIEFVLNEKSLITIDLYNQYGTLVTCIEKKTFPQGKHIVKWDGISQYNQKISNGIYYCVLKSESKTASKKIIMMN